MSERRPPAFLARILVVVLPAMVLAIVMVVSIAFVSVHRMLLREDREELENQLLVLEQSLELGGLQAVRFEIEANSVLGRERPYYVRVADEDNRTLVESIPQQWAVLPFNRLSTIDPGNLPEIYRLTRRGTPYEIEIDTRISPDGTVFQVGMSTYVRDGVLRTALTTAAVALMPIMIVIAALIVWRVQRVVAPVGRLVASMQTLTKRERFETEVSVDRHTRETMELTTVFNSLMKRVDALVQNLRTTLDSLAHDVRTPITRIRNRAELALTSDDGPNDRHELLQDILEESQLISTLVTRTLEETEAMSGMLRIRPTSIDLASLIEEVVDAYAYAAESRGIDLCAEVEHPTAACADPLRVRQAVSNLVDNALKFTAEGSAVRVRTVRNERTATVTVTDEAEIIPRDGRETIWQYRHRSSSEGEGYGIGLFLVRAIARQHGGDARVEAGEKGNRFVLELPGECES